MQNTFCPKFFKFSPLCFMKSKKSWSYCLCVLCENMKTCCLCDQIGVARGVGWQHLGAYINLAAFYLAGIPVAAFLGFWTSLRGVGLWIGILVGASIQLTLLSVVTICTNYEKQVCYTSTLFHFLWPLTSVAKSLSFQACMINVLFKKS